MTFGIIAWVIGIVGIGGAIALFLVAPALAVTVYSMIWRTVLIVWDILVEIWKTRYGCAFLVGLACLAAGNYYGRHTIYAKWEKARAMAKIEADRIDTQASNTVVKADKEFTKIETEDGLKTREELDAYIKELKGAPCVLGDGPALKRLLDIKP